MTPQPGKTKKVRSVNLNDCYRLGQVIRTHGLSGEVVVLLDVDHPGKYSALRSVFLDLKGRLVPFFITSIRIKDTKALIRFDGIKSIEDAKDLVQSKLLLPLDQLASMPAGGYYFHDLIGCIVLEDGKKLGSVESIYDLHNNRLMEIITSDGREVLIPINQKILKKVDVKAKMITVSLPDGLLEVND